MSEPRTFRVDVPPMRGEDIKRAQVEVRREFDRMGIDYPLTADGVYGVASRSAYASLCTAQGILHHKAMKDGVTPELRSKLRDRDKLTAAERKRMAGPKAKAYRRKLRDRHAGGGVCSPLVKIITHANGYSSWHDGVDLICPEDAPAFAICKAKVVRVDDDWWGIGNPGGAKGDRGDGIVIIQSLVDIGPIRKGDYFGYGHGEQPRVKVGQTVEAGKHICDAGMANAWHLHYMHYRGNPGQSGGGGPKGIGNRDPMVAVSYAIKHA